MKHYKEFKKYCENECMINKEICGGKQEEKDCYIAFIDSKYEQAKEGIRAYKINTDKETNRLKNKNKVLAAIIKKFNRGAQK